MRHLILLYGLVFGFGLRLCVPTVAADQPVSFELRAGDRVVFLGDTFIEREQQFGWIELMLTTRFPDRNVSFRNLGWSADTPAGDSRFGLSLLQAGHEPADEGWKQLHKQLAEAKPSVVFVGYGMASSFPGPAGLSRFKDDYNRLLDAIEKISPGVRFVLLGPVRHQWVPSPFPNPGTNNLNIVAYTDVIRQIAEARKARFVSLVDAFKEQSRATGQSFRWTDNGIHLIAKGYQDVALKIQAQLGLAETKDGLNWLSEAKTKSLREAIIQKNEWFFHRSRPENMAYIFGFRKGEQGRNAVEIPKFDPLIEAEEQRIAQLRSLKSGVSVPEIPRRIGNLTTKSTPQPHPNFEVAAGLEVSLWAENPFLNKPIQMNFDAQGRLWVASSEVYPQIEPGQAATDKIIVLEDTKGAGRADKATVFADGLLIPTGVEPGDGGCYVAQSTELLFFKDTDGDGKADVKRTVLSGFGTEDAHHNLHTLRWGFDGRLYMNQSIYTRTDTETPHGVVRLKGGGIFRFDSRDQELEILFKGWVNAWGHQFDDFGQSFVTDGAGGAGINYGLPGASYVSAPKARRILGSVSPGSYPKFCGLEIIRSQHFPADWQGDMITCDFRAHRIVRFKISEQGAGYVTQEMPDVLRTTADTFRPIDLRLGPDGALYVADWSNPIIQHGEVDFRDPRRDKEHGRIWRITVKDRALLPKTDLTKLNNSALLDKLISPNGYDQERAKRILVERGDVKLKKDFGAWQKKNQDEAARLQAMWLSEALNAGQLDVSTRKLATDLLGAKDGRIRAAAVRTLANGIDTIPNATELLARFVADEHPRVRLETIRALGRIKTARAADLALTVLNQPMDTFLDYALWLTINELAEPWLAAVKSGAWKREGHEKQFEFALKSIEPASASEVLGQFLGAKGVPRDGSGPWIELIGSAGGAKELRQLFDPLVRGEFNEAVALRVCAALSEAARLRNVKPTGELESFGVLLKSDNEKLRVAALPLAEFWQLAGFSPQLVQIVGAANTSAEERTAALSALRAIGGEDTIKQLQKLVSETQSPEVRRATVLTIARLNFPAALPEIPAALNATASEADMARFWRGLFGIKGASGKLVTELPTLGLSPEAARVGARIAREENRSLALVQGLIQIAGLTLSDKQLSPAELQALAQEAVAKGDAMRGEHVYRRAELACLVCHAIGGAGGKVGPDLTSIGASAPPDYLVESLLYPNAKIKEGFHSATITTKDDLEFSGIVEKETDREVILRNAANQQVSVVKANISQRVNGGSLMPSGLVDGLLPEERLDLIKFLSVLGKPGDFDAAQGGVARLWRLYLMTSRNAHLGVDGVTRGDFTLADWMSAFSMVNGDLSREVCDALLPSRGGTRGFYVATQFQSAKGGGASFNLGGGTAAAWLNGVPVTVGAQFQVTLKPGVNTLVLQLEGGKLPHPVKLSSKDVSFLTN
jgi:putative heme-binding domain-containing protein